MRILIGLLGLALLSPVHAEDRRPRRPELFSRPARSDGPPQESVDPAWSVRPARAPERPSGGLRYADPVFSNDPYAQPTRLRVEEPPTSRAPAAGDLSREMRYDQPGMQVREIHQMRETEITLVEQLADQVATMQLDQSRMQDRIQGLTTELDKARDEGAGTQSIRARREAGWWERLSFQMPIVAAALGVLAGGSFLRGI